MINIRVVELGQHLAGPYCAWLLASLGAEVIKVELPGSGDGARGTPPLARGRSLFFDSLNRNKRSLTLDLKRPEGQAVLHRLLKQSDVLLENFRPGVRDRMGCSDEKLKAVNPRLIRASISGFGQQGEMAGKPAFDIIVQALGGAMSINGPEGGPLCRVGFSIGDIAAALFTTIGILARLYERDAQSGAGRDPAGEPVEIAMLACQVALLENAYARYLNAGIHPEPIGTRHPSITPFESFPTADEPVVIAIRGPKDWPQFCRVMGLAALEADERFAGEAARLEHHAEFYELVAARTRERGREEWLRLLDEADIPCAPINTVPQFAESDLIESLGGLSEVVTESGGTYRFANNPLRALAGAPAEQPAPRLGEHSREVLAELGYEENEIERLAEDGVI
jgi:crotonobetainyl-CoA:carnitine CoA-transferase CaiB-like acyl-CoA transferase